MDRMAKAVIVFTAILVFHSTLFSQEDLARESGLPSRIGGNRCDWAARGANATLQGTFNVSGIQNGEKPPTFSIALYAGGAFISRQRIRNGGTYFFYCVPDQSVFVVAEVNLSEIMTFSVPALAPPPQTNYQDIFVAWSAAREAVARRNEVVSARNSYDRSKDNQKRFEKAMEKRFEKNGDVTAKMLEEIIEKDPEDYVALTELGTIFCDNKKYSEALPLFGKALALKSEFINAMFGAGRATLALKQLDRSINILTQAYQVNPNSADVNHYLGEAYLQNKQGTLAIEYMRKAIELAPIGKADLHLRIAWLYNAAGAKDLAAQEYKLLLEKKPDHPEKQKLLQYITENSR